MIEDVIATSGVATVPSAENHRGNRTPVEEELVPIEQARARGYLAGQPAG
jgi:hypothetical protein